MAEEKAKLKPLQDAKQAIESEIAEFEKQIRALKLKLMQAKNQMDKVYNRINSIQRDRNEQANVVFQRYQDEGNQLEIESETFLKQLSKIDQEIAKLQREARAEEQRVQDEKLKRSLTTNTNYKMDILSTSKPTFTCFNTTLTVQPEGATLAVYLPNSLAQELTEREGVKDKIHSNLLQGGDVSYMIFKGTYNELQVVQDYLTAVENQYKQPSAVVLNFDRMSYQEATPRVPDEAISPLQPSRASTVVREDYSFSADRGGM